MMSNIPFAFIPSMTPPVIIYPSIPPNPSESVPVPLAESYRVMDAIHKLLWSHGAADLQVLDTFNSIMMNRGRDDDKGAYTGYPIYAYAKFYDSDQPTRLPALPPPPPALSPDSPIILSQPLDQVFMARSPDFMGSDYSESIRSSDSDTIYGSDIFYDFLGNADCSLVEEAERNLQLILHKHLPWLDSDPRDWVGKAKQVFSLTVMIDEIEHTLHDDLTTNRNFSSTEDFLSEETVILVQRAHGNFLEMKLPRGRLITFPDSIHPLMEKEQVKDLIVFAEYYSRYDWANAVSSLILELINYPFRNRAQMQHFVAKGRFFSDT